MDKAGKSAHDPAVGWLFMVPNAGAFAEISILNCPYPHLDEWGENFFLLQSGTRVTGQVQVGGAGPLLQDVHEQTHLRKEHIS